MTEYYSTVCEILKQISTVLSKENLCHISLIPTGNTCWMEMGLSVEVEDVDIPEKSISIPNPKCLNDKDGFYKVNHIHLGKTIIDDTRNGFLYSYDDIKIIIKGINKWAYYSKL